MRRLEEVVKDLNKELIGGVVRIRPDRIRHGRFPQDPTWALTAGRVVQKARSFPTVHCCYFDAVGNFLPFQSDWDVLELYPGAESISRLPIEGAKRGSTVVLKSGGPVMEVTDISAAGISCRWPGNPTPFPPMTFSPILLCFAE